VSTASIPPSSADVARRTSPAMDHRSTPPNEADALAKAARAAACARPAAGLARASRKRTKPFAFLNPEARILHDPLLMLGMAAAVERLERAIATREPVLLYGDYDVDGTTAGGVAEDSDRNARRSRFASCAASHSRGLWMQSSVLEAAYAEAFDW